MMADSMDLPAMAATTESVVMVADVESAEAVAASFAEAAANHAEDAKQEDGVAVALFALKAMGAVHPRILLD